MAYTTPVPVPITSADNWRIDDVRIDAQGPFLLYAVIARNGASEVNRVNVNLTRADLAAITGMSAILTQLHRKLYTHALEIGAIPPVATEEVPPPPPPE